MKMMMKNKTLQWLLYLLAVFASFFFLLTCSEQALVADTGGSDGIRIDCGAGIDPKTNSSYQSDYDRFFEYGEAHNVSSNFTKEQIGNQLKTLRSFPEGKKNCYTLPTPTKNAHYLVRAFFAYGNYDNKTRFPSFDLYIGVHFWATINQSDENIVSFEVIHVSPTEDEINVCLVNTGHGTPFISLLEVLPWQNSRYDQTASSFLTLMSRSKLGMSEDDATYIRYPNDIYERSWFNRKMENSVRINTSMAIDSDTSENTYKLPKEVLSSAVESVSVCSSLVINMDSYSNTSYDYYVYLHFYDFVKKSQNQQRKMVISFSDGVDVSFALEHLKPTTLVRNIKTGDDVNNISIRSTSDSQLPPMLNAYEIYRVLPQPVNSTTDAGDVVAIRDIKNAYGIKRISWQGDPCGPMNYTWEGLTCNNNGTPRIISINLSSSNLTGDINGSFSNFTELTSLDLSNNSLKGKIPESLAKIEKLKYINLTRTEIKCPIPQGLLDRSKDNILRISTDIPKEGEKCGKSKAEKIGAIVGGTGGGVVAISGLAYALNSQFNLTSLFRLAFEKCKKRNQRRNEGRSRKKNDEERRSGKKKEEESNTGESRPESLMGKAIDAVQEHISGL